MKFTRLSMMSFTAAVAIAMLSGCGGGGSSSETPTGTTSSVAISGTVTVASSSTGDLSASAVDAASTGSLIEGAVITIKSYTFAGVSLGETVLSTTEQGSFSTNLPLSSAGGYVVLTSHKEGYVDVSRRIDYETPEDINIMAEMDVANILAVPVGATSTTIGSSSLVKKANGKEYVLFALFKDAHGKSKMMTGKAALSRMATGDKPSVSLEIPKDSIPSDVTTLVGSINSYDPTNPTDAAKFPGSYSDSDGNKLVSLGFDFIDIKTDGGETLGAAIKRAVKKGSLKKSAADDPYYVTRWMNKSNCETLKMGDADKNASNGYNIPIYTYSYVSGEWDLLGNGVIVDNGGSAKTTYSSATTAISSCNTNNGDYVKISVTNKDYLNTPWNLDYPISATVPKQVCVQGKILDQNGEAIKQSVYLSFYDNESSPNSFNWKSVGSKEDGSYKLSTILTDNDDTDRSGTIQYYNPYTYTNETVSATVGETCLTQNITIERPQMCTVTGQIKDDTGAAKAYESFYLYASNPYMSRYGSTGSDGNFTIETRCTLEQGVYVRGQLSKSLNPNGTTDLNETSDNGDTVNVGVLTIANQAPYAYGWLNNNSIRTGTTANIGIYGYDYDNDAPLTWTLKDGPNVIETNTTSGNYLYQNVEKTFTTLGNHIITLNVKDAKNKSTDYTIGTLVVEESNRAPKITSYFADRNLIGPNKSNTLRARGYDSDGDGLSWSFKRGETILDGCSGSSTGGSFDANCTYVTGSNDATDTITFSVIDTGTGNKSASQALSVQVQNTAPIIAQGYASKYRTEVGEDINLTAAVYDIDGDTISAQLYANNVKISGCAFSGKGSAAAPLSGTCTYTMPSTPATVTFRLDASDGSKTRSATLTVVGGNTTDFDIKIQRK